MSWKVCETHARNGWFARLVETIRSGMAGSGTFGPSSLKLGSGLPSMFVIQDMLFEIDYRPKNGASEIR